MAEENKKQKEKKEKSLFIENEDLSIKPHDTEKGAVSEIPAEEIQKKEPVKLEPEKEKEKKEKTKSRVKRMFEFRLKQLGKKGEEVKPVVKEELKSLKLFIFQEEKKSSLFLKVAKNLAIFIISLIIFSLSVYFEISRTAALESRIQEGYLFVPSNQNISVSMDNRKFSVTGEFEINGGEQISTKSVGGVKIVLPGKGELRFDESTDLVVNKFDSGNKEYEIELLSGSLWGNTQYDKHDLVINNDYVSVIPGSASFSVSYDGKKTDVYADKHDIQVKIKADNEEINKFWLAEGSQSQLLNSKITRKKDTIKKLYYTKLIKEFNYSRISSKKLQEDEWISGQKDIDMDYANSVQNQIYDNLSDQGLKTLSTGSIRFQAKSVMTDLQSALTFSESKRFDLIIDSIFENLHDAKYLYLQGNSVDANVRLTLFVQDLNDPAYLSNEYFQQNVFERLNSEYIDLLSVIPGEELYAVKQELFNQLLKNNYRQYLSSEELFRLLTYKINDVYDAVLKSPGESLPVFAAYFDIYNDIVNPYTNRMNDIKDEIVKQNILVDNVLFQYPQLYNIEFFKSKRKMENDYLAAIQDGLEKKEQRQTFISKKIDLLSRIRFFLFNEELTPEEVRQIVFVLLQDIEELKGDTIDDAAVVALFERRLEDFGVFWQYLNSPEYSASELHGASHDERYEEFKKVQEEILTFQDVKDEILGTVEEEGLSVEAILAQAEKDLQEAEIKNIEFGFYEDVTKTRIPILSAEVSGIEFRATYDWDRQLVSNIIVSDELLSREGIKVENAKKFIFEAISSKGKITTRPTQPTEREAEEPLADVKKAAKVFIVEKFSQAGMEIETENITIKDFNNGEYVIEDVYFSENREAKFSFEYRTKDDKVYNLQINTEAGEKTVTDTFSSTFLKAVVLKIYEEA